MPRHALAGDTRAHTTAINSKRRSLPAFLIDRILMSNHPGIEIQNSFAVSLAEEEIAGSLAELYNHIGTSRILRMLCIV
jgi:hypothetical protein